MNTKETKKTAKPKKSADFLFDPKLIPTDAGCYLFKDKDDKIVYVGKAKNLRKRVSSYFQNTKKAPKTASLVKKIRDIETRTVTSEMEALILENNLIKEHRPKYNILLRDDKNFLYLRITKETLPKLEITRRLIRDGSSYIGPRTSAKSFRNTIAFCQKFFGVKMVDSSKDNYIARMKGTAVSEAEYRDNIKRMIRFLRGDTKDIVKELQAKMMTQAEEKNFEAAVRTRDLIHSINGSTERQTMEIHDHVERDFINFVREKSAVFLVRIVFRGGKLIDQNEIQLRAEEWQEDEEILADFLAQFYPHVDQLPREIVLPVLPENSTELSDYLLAKNTENHNRLELIIAYKGDKKRVLELATKNAENFKAKKYVEAMSQAETFSKSLPELTTVLNLATPPKRIECFDISHHAGQETVASQVVFIDGKAKNSEYRRYKLKTIATGEIDDFKSMNEVLTRRFTQITEKKSADFLEIKHITTKVEIKKTFKLQEDWWESRGQPRDEAKDNFFNLEKYIWLIATDIEGKTLGILSGKKITKTTAEIASLIIDSNFQKQGIGKQLVQEFEKQLLKQEIKKIIVYGNKNAALFYKKQGMALLKKLSKSQEKRVQDIFDQFGSETKLLEKKITAEKPILPDLIVIDGGKGQLSSVLKVFKDHPELIPENFDPETQIIALAKREEEVFRGTNFEQIIIDPTSAPSKLLQRIRDEAHRFAITYNRNLRSKALIKSILDEIKGIGGTTKKQLLQTFGSISGVRAASDEDLLKVVNQKQLSALRKQL